jgi:inorganic pyrophosphatase
MESPALPPPPLDALPLRDPGGDWLAVIEASQGSRHKFKYKAAWRAFELSGVLPLGLSFPYDFGFLPSTLGDDGDPLDVLVLADEALPPGSVVPCRIVGVIEAEQQDAGERKPKRNDRIIAVARKAHRYRECRTLRDVAANVLDEIESFFVAMNAQKGGRFTPLARRDAAEAERLVAQGERRFADEK